MITWCNLLVSSEPLIIPENIKYIGDGVFLNCEALESVIITENVISIGESVFKDCHNLTDVTFQREFAMGLTNNDILKKLRVALKMRDDDILKVLELVNFKNKRFMYCSEPEANSKFNANLVQLGQKVH